MLSWFFLGACIIVLGRLFYRLYPVFRGRVSTSADLHSRVQKWNRYVVPHIKRYLESEINVATITVFRSEVSGTQLSVATWGLAPTIVSEVDFIAISDPATTDGSPQIFGFIRADVLRELLDGIPQGNPILGHRIWTYVWPFDDDVTVLSQDLMTTEKFMEHHGLGRNPSGKEDEQ